MPTSTVGPTVKTSVPVAFVKTQPEEIEGILKSTTRGSLNDVALAIAAWRLRLTDQFDELLCLSRLKNVQRLDYQVETVHRVLRTFRGRALLADEVGLGKTCRSGNAYLRIPYARNGANCLGSLSSCIGGTTIVWANRGGSSIPFPASANLSANSARHYNCLFLE